MLFRIYLGAGLSFYIFTRTIFTLIFIVDYKETFPQAIRSSIQITSTRNLETMIIIMLSVVMFLSGVFVLGLGVLFSASPAIMLLIFLYIKYEKLSYLGEIRE